MDVKLLQRKTRLRLAEGEKVNGRSGRKRRLTEQESQRLRDEYFYGQALAAEAQRFSPKALAAKYDIAPTTVYDYIESRHKGEPGYERLREGVHEIVARSIGPGAQLHHNLETESGGALLASVS